MRTSSSVASARSHSSTSRAATSCSCCSPSFSLLVRASSFFANLSCSTLPGANPPTTFSRTSSRNSVASTKLSRLSSFSLSPSFTSSSLLASSAKASCPSASLLFPPSFTSVRASVPSTSKFPLPAVCSLNLSLRSARSARASIAFLFSLLFLRSSCSRRCPKTCSLVASSYDNIGVKTR